MNSKTIKIIQIVSFFFILTILFSGSIISPDKELSDKENRSLSQLPKITATSIFSGDYMTRFEQYMSDQILGRDMFVSSKTFLNRIIGKTEQNGIYIGKNGWLFEKPSEYDEKKLSQTTAAISNFCKQSKIDNRMFVLIPNSSEIVSDNLPYLLSLDSQANQIEEIYSTMSKDVDCIDVESQLKSDENPERLFYKSDHHWTSYGAKTAFDIIAKNWKLDIDRINYQTFTLSSSFSGTLSSSAGIKAKPDIVQAIIPEKSAGTYIIQNSTQKSKSASMFDLSKLESSNQYEVFLGGNFSKLTISTTSETENKLLIFKDSYANCMLPMMTPFFCQITVIDARFFTDEINNIVSDGEFTHLMFLYNVNTFLEDTSLKNVLVHEITN